VDAIKKALDQEAECSDAIEGHIRFHVLDAKTDPTAQTADDLIHALADRLLTRAALFGASRVDCKSTSALNPVPLNLTFQYFYTFLLCSGY
jgi:hypothetical protein